MINIFDIEGKKESYPQYSFLPSSVKLYLLACESYFV